MVAVVSGNGLGLFNTSLTALGGLQGGPAGLGGRAGVQVVNITNGNLILQDQDENLSVRGFNAGFLRTYNSRGTLAGAGQDGWVTGFERKVSLAAGGELNVAGSQMLLTSGDGQVQVFNYISLNNYRSTAGDGAHDTMVLSGTTTKVWTYTEGSTRREEQYADHASTTLLGRLTYIRDLKSDGSTPARYDIIYNNTTATARIIEVRSVDDQPTATATLRDALLFSYNAAGQLSAVSTREGGFTKSQLSYGYENADGSGRLAWVQTDLTPTDTSDNVWDGTTLANNNGKRFRTTYAYLNPSPATDLLIASVTQSDGVTVSYTYETSGDRRVLSVTQGSISDGSAQTVTFSYNANSTDVTQVIDGLSRVWTYQYDASKQITAILEPSIGGQRTITSFTYTTAADTSGAGNVSQIKKELGSTLLSQVNYTYDANGNVLGEWTRIGTTNVSANAVIRTYTTANQVATETRYTGIDTDAQGTLAPTGTALKATYYYDSRNRLQWAVNPANEVIEYTYASTGSGIGQVASERRYFGAAFTGTLSAANLVAWATSAQKVSSQLTEFTYDAKGRLQQSMSFASVDQVSGVGVTTDAANDITSYSYDAQGLLLQKILVRGATRSTTYTATPPAGSEVSSYVYDGMGRLLSVLKRDFASAATDALSVSTTYAYTDSARQIVVTLDSGATRTETRNLAGQTSTIALAGSGQTTRTTQNFFDGAGQLRGSQDASGARRYFFYDNKGRLEAEVDATGAVTKYVYDGADRRINTVQYANRVTTTSWLSGSTVTVANFAAIGVVADTNNDRTSVNTFDVAGRLLTQTQIVVAGTERQITTYTYDGAGRVILIRTTDSVGTVATARETRQFYDAVGRLVATLDAERYLVRTTYDSAGRVIQTTRSAGKIVSPTIIDATTLLSTLTIPLDAVNDQTTRYFYNGRGQQIGTLDAQGYLTEAIVDEAGNTRAERRYGAAVSWAANDTLSTLRGKVPNYAQASSYRESKSAYNALGQLFTQTNYEGTVTKFTYDEAGRLVRTQAAEATSEVREGFKRYNVFDELIGEITGQQADEAYSYLGNKLLTDASLNETQLNDVYNRFGMTHSYDAMSRLIESIGPQVKDAQGNYLSGNKTFYFYDSQGNQRFVVKGVAQDNAGVTGVPNSYGEVTETRYNAFGQVTESMAYTGRIVIPVAGDRASVQSAITIFSSVSYFTGNTVDTRRQFMYDQRGLLKQSINALNVSNTYNYTAFGQLNQEIRAVGDAAASVMIQHNYDKRGLVTSRIDASGNTLARTSNQTYDAFGRVISSTDARGAITTVTYDRLGRQITRSLAITSEGVSRAETTTLAYDAFSQTTRITDALGNFTTYVYSDVNRSLIVTSQEGVAVTTTHNRFGQTATVSQVMPDGTTATTTNTYDKNGDLISITNPLGQVTSYPRNVLRQLYETIDATGRKVRYSYDAVGRVLSRTDDPTGLNLITTTSFDGQGRQVKVTDASGRITTMSYDQEGRLLQTVQDPSGLNLRTSYTYDALGRQIDMIEGVGTASTRTTRYVYDVLGRRTQERVDPNGLNLTTNYLYDANDNVLQRTDATGNVARFVYDEANRRVYDIDATGGVSKSTYDKNGQVIAVRSYATAIVVSDLSTTAGATATTIRAKVDLVANETIDQISYRVYDRDNRLRFSITNLSSTTASISEQRYDSAGRASQSLAYVAAFTDTTVLAKIKAGTAVLTDFTSYVTANEAAAQRQSSVYDAAGRLRFSVDALGTVTEQRYDSAGRAIQSLAYVTAFTDAAVLVKIKAGTAILSDFDTYVTSNEAAAQRQSSVYDAAGRLRFSVDVLGNVTEQRYDAAGRVVQSLAYATALTDSTFLAKIKAGTALVAEFTTFITANDAAASRQSQVYDSAGRLRFSVDALGNVTEQRYDAAGRVVHSLAYATALTDSTLLGKIKAGTALVAEFTTFIAANDVAASRQSQVYDAAGRLRFSVDALGNVTERRYDAAGRVVQSLAYAVALTDTALLTKIKLGTATLAEFSTFITANDATAQRQSQVYDGAGRLRFSIDTLGGVYEQRYDAAGRVTETLRYTSNITLSAALKTKLQAGDATALADINTLLVARTTLVWDTGFDSAAVTGFSNFGWSFPTITGGRAAFARDPAVTATRPLTLITDTRPYLSEGLTYSSEIRIGGSLSGSLYLSGIQNEAAFQSATFLRDAIYMSDGVLYRHQFTGAVETKTVLMNLSLDTTYMVETETAADHVTTFVYAKGSDRSSGVSFTRQTDSVTYGRTMWYAYSDQSPGVSGGTVYLDNASAISRQHAQVQANRYDAAGRLIRSFDALGQVTEYGYDAAGRRISVTDARGNTSYSVYDVAGRLTYSIDTSGAYTRYWYDTSNRVVAMRRFNAQLTPAQLGTTLTVGALDGLQQSQSIDQGEYRVYDSAGRLRLSIDLASGLQEYTYDASGLLISTKRYANSIAGLSTPILNKLFAGTASVDEIKALVTADNTRDIRSHSLYDAAGRMIFSINGKGEATRYWYDATGKVSATVRFTNTINMATFSASTTIDSVQNQLSWTNAQGDYQIYDAAGRVRYTYTSLGNVQEFVYDANGRVVLTRRFAQPHWISGDIQARLFAGLATEADFNVFATDQRATAQVLNNVFDSEGRVRYSITALGEVSENSYDAVGQLVATSQYGNRIAMPTNGYSTESSVKSALIAAGGDSRVSNYVYDVQGRLRYTLTRPSNGNSSVWVVSERRYDALGQLKSEIGYAKTITLSVAPTESNVVSALGAVSEAERRVTQHVYDNAGRLRFTIDDAGYVKEQRYDALGQVSHSISYNTLLSANVPLTQTDIANALVGASGRQVRAVYDSAGRLVQSIDALNQSEYFSYDSLGNNVSKTDKLGNVWTYEYDAAGRQAVERSPQVSVSRYDNAGNIVSELRSIVTRINYDVFGNVIERIENADTAEARSIQYQYDAMNRQIKTVFPDAGTVGFNGQFTFSGTQPYIQVSYNARGEATVQRDVRDAYTYKIYNHVGQVAYEVDAERNVSENIYNAYGEQVSLRRYANKVSVSALNALGWSEGGSISLSQMLSSGVLSADPINDRVITTQYDARGLKISVQQSAVVFYDQNGQLGVGLLSPTSVFEYNAFGELVKESVQLDASNWAYTHHYYDDLGRKTLSVDAEGYLTSWQYNAQAEVTRMIEHARAINPSSITTTAPPSLPSVGDVSVGLDRSVSYSYDALGRKISETSNRRFANTNGTYGARDVLSSIEYDAMNRVTGTTVDGVITRLGYDALGRNTSLRESERQALLNSADAALQSTIGIDLSSAQLYQYVSPYTAMQMDAFGNVLQVRRYANGADSQGNAVQSAADAVTQMRYDRQGRMVWESDAEGTARINKYDAAENVTEQQYYLVQNNGRRDLVVSNFTYDKTGRQLSTTTKRLHEIFVGGTYQAIADDVATLTINESQTWDAAERVTYNGFGEIITKTHDGISGSMLFEYDKAGRVLRNNSEGGVMRNYGYNLAGAQNFQSYQVATDSSTLVNLVTRQQLDRLGRTSVTTMPAASTNSAETKAVRQRYDRWGNVLEVIDPRGYQTNYQYNQFNKIIREERPLVLVVSETGVQTWQRPVSEWFYDAQGRELGSKDANGNMRMVTLDSAGRVIANRNAMNQVTLTAYDALGRARMTQSPLGYITFQNYDRMDRVNGVGDYLRSTDGLSRTKQLREQYVLDVNGRRKQVVDALSNTTRYDYDSRGMLVRSQTAMGVVMGYGYDVLGNKIRETNALSDPRLLDGMRPVYNGGLPDSLMTVAGQPFSFILPENFVSVVGGEPLNIQVKAYSNGYVNGWYSTLISNEITYDAVTRTLSGTPTTSTDVVFTVTLPSTGAQVEFRTSIGVVTSVATWYVGSPQIKRGILNPTPNAGGAWSMQVPADTFADPTNQTLTYTGKIGYWVNDVIEYDAESRGYFVSERAHWEYRDTTATDWVQFDASTRTFSTRAGYSVPPGNWQLMIIATDTDAKATGLEIRGFGKNPNPRVNVTDSEENELSYLHEQTWDYDVFGRVTDYNDLGGLDYDYQYSAAGNILSQNAGALAATPIALRTFYNRYNSQTGEFEYIPEVVPSVATNQRQIKYFANGQIREIREGNNVYTYAYDSSGNRVLEQSLNYDSNGVALHVATRMTYDSNNRLQRVVQDDLSLNKRLLDLWYDYDAVGNRRRVVADGAFAAGAANIPMNNTAPYLVAPVGDRTLRSNVSANFSVLLSNIFRDRELDTLGLDIKQVVSGSETTLPSWLSYSLDDNGRLSFFANGSSQNVGDVTVRLKVTDGVNLTPVMTEFVIHVVTNSAPIAVLGTPPEFVARFDRNFLLELPVEKYFRDIDVNDSISLSLGGSLPSWITVDTSNPAVVRLSGRPTVANAGVFSFNLVAADELGAVTNQAMSIRVRANNVPTVAKTLNPIIKFTDRLMAWQEALPDVFTDADSDELNVIATLADGSPLPTWLNFRVDYVGGVPQLKLIGVPPSTYPDNTQIIVKLTAADGQNSISTNLSITIRLNQAPQTIATISALDSKINKDFYREFAVAGLFSDANGDALNYRISTTAPTSDWLRLTYDSNRGVVILSGRPPATATGNFSVALSAVDPSGAVATYSIPLAVRGDTAPQYVSGINNQTIYTSRNFTFTLPSTGFNDADGDQLSYQAWAMVWFPGTPGRRGEPGDPAGWIEGPLPAWLNFNAVTRTFSGVAPAGTSTTKILIGVTDETGKWASKDFDLSVSLFTNTPPQYNNNLVAQNATEGAAVDIALPNGAFTDVNSDLLTYSAQILIGSTWVNFPQIGLNINAATGRITGTPSGLTQGSYSVRIFASDGPASANGTFTLTVNRKPVAPNSQTLAVIEGVAFNHQLIGYSDPEGTAVTYTATKSDGTALPAWLTVSSSGQVSGTPPVGFVGLGLSIRVQDASGLFNYSTFTINVNNPPPQYVAGSVPATLSLPGNVAWSYQVPSNAFTNQPVAEVVTYSAKWNGGALPAWLSFNANPASRTFSGTPPIGTNGTLSIYVTDMAGGVAATNISFSAWNAAPQYNNTLGNQNFNQGAAVDLVLPTNTFTDANQEALTYTAFVERPAYSYEEMIPGTELEPLYNTINVPAAWYSLASSGLSLSINSSTGRITGTANVLNEYQFSWTNYRIKIVAKDASNTQAEGIFSLNINQAPVLPAPTNFTVGAKTSFSRALTNAYDPDGTALTFSATGLPAGVTINSSNGTLSGTAPVAGSYVITVYASDGVAVSSTTITLVAQNYAPVLNASIGNQNLNINTAWNFTVAANTFIDTNGDTLTYSASGLPAGISFNAATRTFSGTQTTPGNYTITLSVSDGIASPVSTTFTLNVINPSVNNPPQTSGIPDFSVTSGAGLATYNIKPYFTDPNGDTLTYSQVGAPSWFVFNASTGVFSGSTSGTLSNQWTITVTANDNRGGTISTSFTLYKEGSGGGGQLPLSIPTSPSASLSTTTNFNDATDEFGRDFEYTGPVPVWDTEAVSETQQSFSLASLANQYEDGGGLIDAPGGNGQVGTPVNTNTANAKGYWFTYDAENRMLVANGSLINNQIQIINQDISYLLSYNEGGQATARIVLNQSGLVTETSQFTERGELRYVIKGGTVMESRDYDAAGRLSNRKEYFAQSHTLATYNGVSTSQQSWATTGWLKHEERYFYDKDGRTTLQQGFGRVWNWTIDTRVSIADQVNAVAYLSAVEYNNAYDNAGRLIRYRYHSVANEFLSGANAQSPSNYAHTYVMSYQLGSSYQEHQVWGFSNNTNFKASVSTSQYDAWGRRVAVREQTPGADPKKVKDRVRYYHYDAEGGILQRREGIINNGAFSQVETINNQTTNYQLRDTRYTYANGQQVARQTKDGEFSVAGGPSIRDSVGNPLAGYNMGLYAGRSIVSAAYRGMVNQRVGTGLADATLLAAKAREQQDMQKAISKGQAEAPGAMDLWAGYGGKGQGLSKVQVQPGETLQSFAQRVYGNSSMWYLIAEANGLASSEPLIGGTMLSVPDAQVTKNDASTFKPYNPMEAIGNTAPTMPYLPPPPKANCGAMIIMIIVAVVVSVVTYGAMAGPMSAMLSATTLAAGTITTAGAIAAGFVAGVASSIASQVVGKALGVVDHFSLKDALISGITGAIGAGVGQALKGAQWLKAAHTAVDAGEKLTSSMRWALAGKAAIQGVASYAGGVVARAAVGQKTNFSWAGVAATAIGSAVSGAMGIKMPGAPTDRGAEFAQEFVNGLVGGSVNASVQRAFGLGKQDWAQIGMDAFGNAVGSAIGKGLLGPILAYQERKSLNMSRQEYVAHKNRGETPNQDLSFGMREVNGQLVAGDNDLKVLETQFQSARSEGDGVRMGHAGGIFSMAMSGAQLPVDKYGNPIFKFDTGMDGPMGWDALPQSEQSQFCTPWDNYGKLAMSGEMLPSALPFSLTGAAAETAFNEQSAKIDAWRGSLDGLYLQGAGYRDRHTRHNALVSHLSTVVDAYEHLAFGGERADAMLRSVLIDVANNNDANPLLIAAQQRPEDLVGLSKNKVRQLLADGMTRTMNNGIEFAVKTRLTAQNGTTQSQLAYAFVNMSASDQAGLGKTGFLADMGISLAQAKITTAISLLVGLGQAASLGQDQKMGAQLASIGLISPREARWISKGVREAQTDIPARVLTAMAGNRLLPGKPTTVFELSGGIGDAEAAPRLRASSVINGVKGELADLLGSDLKKLVRHRAGNMQVELHGNVPTRMHFPAGTTAKEMAAVLRQSDKIGDLLQVTAQKYGQKWDLGNMTDASRSHYQGLIEAAAVDGSWSKAALYRAQMRGQWVERQVLKDIDVSGAGIAKKPGNGVDVIYGGRSYDIMSATEYNYNLHAKRMPDQVFRMIGFGK